MKILSLFKRAIALAILSSAIVGHANTDFYLTTTGTDGTGTGTVGNPFVAASANSYTWVLTNKQSNYTFHYQPGTYQTYGWHAGTNWPNYSDERRTAWSGSKHLGTGTNTIIKLVGASSTNVHDDGMIFACNAWIASCDGFELHDLTLDCNANNQPKFSNTNSTSVTGVWLSGNNITLQNLTVVRFGAINKECFPLAYGTEKYSAATNFGNILFDNITVTSPATNNLNGGLTCFGIGSFRGTNQLPGITHNLTNAIVTNCHVLNVKSDFLYSQGFSVPTLLNSTVDGCATAFYQEPNHSYDNNYDILYTIKNNLFTNVGSGIFSLTTGTNVTENCGSYLVESNRIYISESDTYHHGAAFWWYTEPGGTSIFSSITLRDNIVSSNNVGSGVNLFGFNFRQFYGDVVTNIWAAYNTITLPDTNRGLTVSPNLVQFSAVYENRSASNVLLPITERIADSVGGVTATQQRCDFNLDAHADILWRDQFSGSNLVWFLNGTNLVGSKYISQALLPSSWQIAAVADFDGDLNNDILWQSTIQPSNLVWSLSGTNWLRSTFANKITNAPFQVVGAGRFTDSGYTDLVWRDIASGSNLLWLRHDVTNWLELSLPNRVGANFTIAGTGDFDGDRKTDIVWRDYTTGLVDVWLMDGTNYLRTVPFNSAPALSSDQRIVGVDDFTGDGQVDILLRDYTSGTLSFWQMSQTNVVAAQTLSNLPTMPTIDWYIAGGPASSATPTRYVATSGSNTNAGTYDLPYRTVQFGASATPSGAVLRAFPGNYAENVNMRTYNVKLTVINGTLNLR
ncbi:MAG: hypothetical protein JWM68_4806 [Verrucomicrobiales bacterium]|nr:hypothetical protein [Verrucomicrobiales bacterium]